MESQATLSSAALALFPRALDLCMMNSAVKHCLWYTASVASISPDTSFTNKWVSLNSVAILRTLASSCLVAAL